MTSFTVKTIDKWDQNPHEVTKPAGFLSAGLVTSTAGLVTSTFEVTKGAENKLQIQLPQKLR